MAKDVSAAAVGGASDIRLTARVEALEKALGEAEKTIKELTVLTGKCVKYDDPIRLQQDGRWLFRYSNANVEKEIITGAKNKDSLWVIEKR